MTNLTAFGRLGPSLWLTAAFVLVEGCSPGVTKEFLEPNPAPTLTHVLLTPAAVALAPGANWQFAVAGAWSDGSAAVPAVAYSATGGTITAGGLYTAGTLPGAVQVIATQQAGTKADTSLVTISASAATLLQLALSPASLTLAPGETGQFTVAGSWSDGSTTVPAATYSSSGGTITTGGLYRAGTTAGSFRVTATQLGGTKADTSAVTITADTGVRPLWTADMETGNLKQWEDNVYQVAPCGGQFDTGPEAVTIASMDYARSGLWSAKMVIGGNPTGAATNGTRMYRWCEPQQHPDLFYSAWFYIPQHLTIASSGWLNLFQYNSKLPGASSADPFFFLDAFNDSTTGAMRFRLTWWAGQQSEGPYSGQHGYRVWDSPQDIPVGRWFQVQARHVCAGDFTGAIQVWQDDVELFNLAGVRTRYPNGDCQWAVNNYGTGISPSPVVVYVDDVAIAQGRIGP